METFFTMDTLVILGSLTLINLVLSGDNAIIIALASRNLPPQQQKKAMFWGIFGAVFFRVILTVAAVYLLKIPYLMLAGGIALLYIAVKLLVPNHSSAGEKEAKNLTEAIKIILMADVIMSLDNVLAIAAIVDGHIGLLVIGLLISIPIVVLGSKILLMIMEKYTFIIYAGAGILGWTAGKMIVNDATVASALAPFALMIEITLTALVLLVGHWLKKRQERAGHTPVNNQ